VCGLRRGVTREECGLSSTGAERRVRTWARTVRLMPHRHGLRDRLESGRLVAAGFHTIIYLADWHAYINDKLGGNLGNLRRVPSISRTIPGSRVPDASSIYTANESVRHPEYWRSDPGLEGVDRGPDPTA